MLSDTLDIGCSTAVAWSWLLRTLPSRQSWMLVVHTPVRNSSISKVKKCAGMKNSVQQ